MQVTEWFLCVGWCCHVLTYATNFHKKPLIISNIFFENELESDHFVTKNVYHLHGGTNWSFVKKYLLLVLIKLKKQIKPKLTFRFFWLHCLHEEGISGISKSPLTGSLTLLFLVSFNFSDVCQIVSKTVQKTYTM